MNLMVFGLNKCSTCQKAVAWLDENDLKYHFSDVKEVPLDVPSQVCITRDNTQLQVDGIIYFQVTDAAFRDPVLGVAIYYAIMILYFAAFGRTQLVLSPEEEFAMSHGKADYKTH